MRACDGAASASRVRGRGSVGLDGRQAESVEGDALAEPEQRDGRRGHDDREGQVPDPRAAPGPASAPRTTATAARAGTRVTRPGRPCPPATYTSRLGPRPTGMSSPAPAACMAHPPVLVRQPPTPLTRWSPCVSLRECVTGDATLERRGGGFLGHSRIHGCPVAPPSDLGPLIPADLLARQRRAGRGHPKRVRERRSRPHSTR